MPGHGYRPGVKIICNDRSRVSVTSRIPDTSQEKSCLAYYRTHHLYVASLKMAYESQARCYLYVTGIKYFCKAVIPSNVNLMQ